MLRQAQHDESLATVTLSLSKGFVSMSKNTKALKQKNLDVFNASRFFVYVYYFCIISTLPPTPESLN